MKKQYIAPALKDSDFLLSYSLLQTSATGLDGFGGNGGDMSGGTADSRDFQLWDTGTAEEEY